MDAKRMNFDVSDFRRYFQSVFNNDPFPFQEAVASQLITGNNVVVLAPTGAGKTRAPIAAFAYSKHIGLPFADRLIYALPQRTLTIALRDSVKESLNTAAPHLRVTIQTGNMPEDPFFEGDVIFTTIDQLLSAYIEVPVSLTDRLANIPAGALIGALMVFDEFHLLEPGRALATALDLARQLKPFSRTLLMSATFPQSALSEVVRRAKAVPVCVNSSEISCIPSQHNKHRRFVWHPEALTAEAVVKAHKDRTIVVANRVDRAQDLYEEIKNLVDKQKKPVRLLLLHSRFLQGDRQAIEEEVINHFKRDGLGNAILVATQVVEVGLDITCEILHTELATASSLFQRAGRCARYENQKGQVHIYELERNETGRRRYGPYWLACGIVDRAAEQIQARSGLEINFLTEQEIVNNTHRDEELRQLAEVLARRRGMVLEAQRSHQSSFVRELVRMIDSVNILIHHDPTVLDMARRPETFSLPRSVLQQMLRGLDLAGQHAGKVCWPDYPDDAEDYHNHPEWKPLAESEDADKQFVLSLHPSLVSYDNKYGLRLMPLKPGGYESRPTLDKPDSRIGRFSYHKEYFADHITAVVREISHILLAYRVSISRLAAELGLNKDDIHHLCYLVGLLHDLGKLSTGVQEPMWRWMRDVHSDLDTGFLAHTELDANDSRQVAKEREARYRRQPHALEGAEAATPVLGAVVRDLELSPEKARAVADALFSAIARHHSPNTSTLRAFVLAPGAREEVKGLLSSFGFRGEPLQRPSEVRQALVRDSLVYPETHEAVYPLYLLVVRLLRLADQKAAARKE